MLLAVAHLDEELALKSGSRRDVGEDLDGALRESESEEMKRKRVEPRSTGIVCLKTDTF